MATSQNGWIALSGYDDAKLVRLAGFPGSIHRAVAPIFEYLISEFARRVEPVEGPVRDDWAYSYRPISGTSVLSNHSSGTAIDLNALKHPQFKTGTFTEAQVREIRAILAELDDVVQWGGDWAAAGRADEMHFEIRKSASEAKVLGVAARLEGAPRTVTVLKGEGWWQVARRAGVSMDALLAANGATVATMLRPDQVLKVAAA